MPGWRGLLVVFGATGGTGLALLPLALERGWAVRAFVRNRSALERELGDLAAHEALEIVQADLGDLVAVSAAVAGARAVISLAGARPETAPGPMAAAVPAMVQGCRAHGVQKLLYQSCALAIAPGERPGWFSQAALARTIVRWQLQATYVDDNEQVMLYLEEQVHDVPWVVSRPGGLADGDDGRDLSPNLDPFKASTVRYGDIAAWTLEQVDSDKYVRKMPRLYYGAVQSPI